MKVIQKTEPKPLKQRTKKRVAAYARVSIDTKELKHSFAAQISYYNDKIQKNPDWLFAGIYADEGISGTGTAKRAEFNRLIADCDAGKIDLILTKSISRFARNTVDLLRTVRHLKEIGVEVWFERENIHSLSGDGELMLTILASFAQEESRSISENCKWGIRKRYEQGIPHSHFRAYGYRWNDDQLVPDPVEAPIVKRMFQDYIGGKCISEIVQEFDEEGIKNRNGRPWLHKGITSILTNITYTGDLLLQKEFVSDPINKKLKKNCGELPKYLIRENHEPIIDQESFDQVQEKIALRKKLGPLGNRSLNISCFTGRIKCEKCGQNLQRNSRNHRTKTALSGEKEIKWRCASRGKKSSSCSTRNIPEYCLIKACSDALGLNEFDESIFTEKVDHISVPDNGKLVFHFKDGTEKIQSWERSKPDMHWTEEHRLHYIEAINKRKEAKQNGEDYNEDSCKR